MSDPTPITTAEPIAAVPHARPDPGPMPERWCVISQYWQPIKDMWVYAFDLFQTESEAKRGADALATSPDYCHIRIVRIPAEGEVK